MPNDNWDAIEEYYSKVSRVNVLSYNERTPTNSALLELAAEELNSALRLRRKADQSAFKATINNLEIAVKAIQDKELTDYEKNILKILLK